MTDEVDITHAHVLDPDDDHEDDVNTITTTKETVVIEVEDEKETKGTVTTTLFISQKQKKIKTFSFVTIQILYDIHKNVSIHDFFSYFLKKKYKKQVQKNSKKRHPWY